MEVKSQRNQNKRLPGAHTSSPTAASRRGRGAHLPSLLNSLMQIGPSHLPGEQTPQLVESERCYPSGNTADRFSFESKSQRQNGSQTCGWGPAPPPPNPRWLGFSQNLPHLLTHPHLPPPASQKQTPRKLSHVTAGRGG